MSSYSRYPKYKDSCVEWLGAVPEHWGIKRSKYVFREVNERSVDGGEELLSVSEYYGVKPRADVMKDEEHLSRAESLEGYKKCEQDDLVMNIMLAWKRGLGVTQYSGIVSPAYSVFRCFTDDSPRYLHSLLRTDTYISEFKRRSTGVIDSRLRLYPEIFGGVEVLLPPPDEQVAISSFLDRETARIDSLIEKKQRLIELLKEKRQAVITQAVTKGLDPTVPMKDSGVEWLGEVPEHWSVSRLKYECSHIVDCLHSTPTYVEDGEYPAIRTADISPGVLDLENARRVYAIEYQERISRLKPRYGDIVYSREGERFGMAAEIPDNREACLGQRVMMFRPSRDNYGRFLMWQLNSTWVYWQADQDVIGATSPHVNVATIKNFLLVMPPREEQMAIAMHIDTLLAKVDGVIQKTTESIVLLRERRSALITAAVTGQIDVRDAA